MDLANNYTDEDIQPAKKEYVRMNQSKLTFTSKTLTQIRPYHCVTLQKLDSGFQHVSTPGWCLLHSEHYSP